MQTCGGGATWSEAEQDYQQTVGYDPQELGTTASWNQGPQVHPVLAHVSFNSSAEALNLNPSSALINKSPPQKIPRSLFWRSPHSQ